MNILLTTAIALAIVGGVHSNSLTTHLFDVSIMPEAFLAEVEVEDRDGNRVQPRIIIVAGNAIVKTDTMPRSDDVNATAIHENNYVSLPYVSNPTNNILVRIRYTYRQTQPCPNYSGRQVQCKNYVMMYLVNVANYHVGMKQVDIVTNSLKTFNLSAPSGYDIKTYVNIPAATTGYRLVIHDEGSSFEISKVTLTTYYCELNLNRNYLPIICPETPATNARDVLVRCRCGDVNSKPDSGRVTIAYYCKFHPTYGGASYEKAPADNNTSCECNPGYTTYSSGMKYCKESRRTATTLPPPATHAAGGQTTTKRVTVKPTAAAAGSTSSSKPTVTAGCSKLTNSCTLTVVCLCGVFMKIYP